MNKKDAISKISRQIQEIRKVKATALFGATYSKWQRDTRVALSNIFGDNKQPAREFKELLDTLNYKVNSISSEGQKGEYNKELERAEVFLESCIREIDEYWPDVDKSQNKNEISAFQTIEMLCSRFHLVAKQLMNRREERATIEINDEYDVQDLLHGILRIFFDDIRPEEWAPSYAGKSSRMDFLLKRHSIVIETKMARHGLNAKEIGSQLIEDIARYREHPDCNALICFVYDPEGIVNNPVGLENDLNRFENDLNVKVLILPK